MENRRIGVETWSKQGGRGGGGAEGCTRIIGRWNWESRG